MSLRKSGALVLAVVVLVAVAASQMADDRDRAQMEEQMMDDRMATMDRPSGNMRIDPRSMAADRYGMAMGEEVDKREMVVGMMMNYAEDEYPADFRPKDFMDQCPDEEAIVDAVMAALEERDVLADRPFCNEWEDRAQACVEEGTETCDQIRKGRFGSEDAPAMTCPPEREQMVNYCISKFEEHTEERDERMAEMCQEQWKEQKKMCGEREQARQERQEQYEQYQQERDETLEEFNDSQDEFEEFNTTDDTADDGNLTAEYEGMHRIETPEEVEARCERETFITQCKERMGQMQEQMRSEVQRECQQSADRMMEDAQQMCNEREEAYNQCMAHHEEACSFATEAADTCTSMPRDELRAVLREKAATMCEVHERMTSGDEHGEMLQQMRNVSNSLNREQQAAVSENEDEYLAAAKKLEQVEERESSRGIGYAAKRMLGMAAKQEQQDIEDLQDSVEQMNKTIASLERIAEQTSDATARQQILNQVDRLKDRRDELQQKIDEKKKRARGILSLFG